MNSDEKGNPPREQPNEKPHEEQAAKNEHKAASSKPEEIAQAPVKKPKDKLLEKWLWVDPFTENKDLESRMRSGAVLLAEDIVRYVEFDLLIKQVDFKAGEEFGAKLKGASYTMTPDPEEGWMIDEKNKLVRLKIGEDPSGRHFIVPRHSLVFIRLKQRLRIPYYMIGRHNLKIRYVYQGLLLGTGPQVDPGYVGNLYIPLHNFTTTDVNVYFNDSFVSIDFARTSPLSFDQGEPQTLDELYAKYEGTKWLFDKKKLNGRARLTDYLEGKTPQSAMVGLLRRYEDTLEDLKKIKAEAEKINDQVKEHTKTVDNRLDAAHSWHRIEIVAVAAIAVGALIGLITWFQELNQENRVILSNEFNNQITQVNNKLISDKEIEGRALRASISDMSNALLFISSTQQQIARDHTLLMSKVNAIETNSLTSDSSAKAIAGTKTNSVVPFK